MELREQANGQVVVDVHSPIDRGAGTHHGVLLDTLRLLMDQGYTCILLNVAQVTYVDSVLLGAIVQAYTSAVRRGGTLKLLHATNRFRELLHVTKLDTVLDVLDSE
jgi:anti-anti-sigma factor